MPAQQSITWIQELWRQCPTVAILVVIIVTGSYNVWIWGQAYRDMKEDRDRFRAIAFESVGILEKAPSSSALAQSTPVSESQSDPSRRERWRERRERREQERAAAPIPTPSPAAAVPTAEISRIRAKLSSVQAKSPKE